ncbi:unnamed protein product [Arctia plantaginis]|uniref:Uncharacterized protein n=1 Tax=Arctia plantaginis TaxID=874455 RepID=A0A8S0YVP8_ARCPL|nr:unnamed protein product [Arctia plantaginis]CAB3247801.1 unnamed protein product [Arctia plantaginis]
MRGTSFHVNWHDSSEPIHYDLWIRCGLTRDEGKPVLKEKLYFTKLSQFSFCSLQKRHLVKSTPEQHQEYIQYRERGIQSEATAASYCLVGNS